MLTQRLAQSVSNVSHLTSQHALTQSHKPACKPQPVAATVPPFHVIQPTTTHCMPLPFCLSLSPFAAIQSRRLLTSSSSPSSLHHTPFRSYYPSTPAQHATVSYVLPALATIPCLAIYWLGREDYAQKTKAFRRTLSGGEGFEERIKRKKVKAGPQRKDDE